MLVSSHTRGVVALAVMAALSMSLAVSPAAQAATSASASASVDTTASSAAAHPTPHTSTALRPRGAKPAVITGPVVNHGGPTQTAPKVYVDYWGWTSDPNGEQTYLNNFLSNVGGTSWLATVGQYGGGSQTGLLTGIWSDPAAVPAAPSDAQIQAEAANAASHFGAGTSVNVQIVVATPTGHSTPGFGTQWCGYHGAVAADPSVTYTDLPYMTDAGGNCGENSVNTGSGGILDGVSIVEGHELAESITDPLLSAWWDAGGNEVADKCAWGGLADLATPGGQFAVQPLWSNAANNCVLSTGSTPGPNLLSSPSFEGSTAGWQAFIPTGGSVSMVDYNTAAGAPAPAHDGTWYLGLGTNAVGGSAYQDVNVNAAANSSWTATAWIAAQSGTVSGTLCAWALGPNIDSCHGYTVGTGYTQVQVVLSLPTAYTSIRFQDYPTANGGTTDLDTTSLIPNMLTAGSFEQNTTGWQTLIPSGGTVNMVNYNTAAGAPAIAQDSDGYLAFNTNTLGGSVYQNIPVSATAGSTYTATVWLSSQSGTTSGTFCLWGLGINTDSCTAYSVAAGTYTYLKVLYTAPQALSTLRFQVYPTANAGTTDMDTASLVTSS
jgi:hypothetical protein